MLVRSKHVNAYTVNSEIYNPAVLIGSGQHTSSDYNASEHNTSTSSHNHTMAPTMIPTQTQKKILTKPDIEEGLVALSDALRIRAPQLGLQLPIRAVVAGGVVAVVKFGARTNTHDVDFALNAGQIDLENLIQRVADEVSEAPHPTDGVQEHNLFKYWFNPAMSYYLNGPAYQGAYTEALRQGEVLFRSDTLELYIAPWKFQLYRKMGRVTKALWQTKERRLTDIEDTVDLIHQFNTRRKQPLTLSELRGWYQDPSTKLDHPVAQEAARIISERYRAKYGGNFRL